MTELKSLFDRSNHYIKSINHAESPYKLLFQEPEILDTCQKCDMVPHIIKTPRRHATVARKVTEKKKSPF